MLDVLAHEVRQPLNNASAALQAATVELSRDGKLSAEERPQRKGMLGSGRHGGGERGGIAFRKLDADGDGKVSRAEAAADPSFAQRLDTLDANKDGAIDRVDRELRGKQHRDAWFAKADADKDGKLSRAEFDRMGEACGRMHGDKRMPRNNPNPGPLPPKK